MHDKCIKVQILLIFEKFKKDIRVPDKIRNRQISEQLLHTYKELCSKHCSEQLSEHKLHSTASES